MVTKTKKSSTKKLIVNGNDIQENVIKKLFDFECNVREIFKEWVAELSREEINAHIKWVASKSGAEFLDENSQLVSSQIFNYMIWAEQRYEEDSVNDPGSELCDSLDYVIDEEFVIKK